GAGPNCEPDEARGRRQVGAALADALSPEDRAEHLVGPADLLRFAAAGQQREHLLDLVARRGLFVLAHVGQLPEGDFQRERDAVEAVDGDRLLSTLDLTDELAAEARLIPQLLLTPAALLSQRPKSLTEQLPHAPHSHVPLSSCRVQPRAEPNTFCGPRPPSLALRRRGIYLL